MTRAIIVAAALLALASCGTNAPDATSSSTSKTSSQTAADTGSCDTIADAVHTLVSGTSGHTDKTVGGFELCKWDSTEGPGTGGHYFVQATLTDASAYASLSAGFGQAETDMTGVTTFAPRGFAHATGFWNDPTHRFMLLVEQGDHTVLIEGSAPRQPSTDALVDIAHTLAG